MSYKAKILELAAGGTNAALTASNGGIIYSSASAMAVLAGTATANQVLVSGANSAPSWSTATFPPTAGATGTILRSDGTNWVATTATYPATTTINQLIYSTANNVLGGLTTANNGTLVTSSTGVPSILAGPGTTGNVLQSNAAAAPSFSTATYPSTVTVSTILYGSASNVVSGLATANNGTLVTSNTGVPSVLAGPGTTGNVFQSNAAAAPSFSTATYPSTTTINQVLYSSANNTVAGITAANNGTMISGTTGVPSWLANGTTGQVLTATTGSPPSWAANAAFTSINVQVFTSTGTYTPTSGMKYCIIECVGGGGGGGATTATGAATVSTGGGGGSGGYSRKFASAATIGVSQAVTIGAAGTAGATSGGNGGAGGTTSLGAICNAGGGNGGAGSGAVAFAISGGGGGATSGTGDVVAAGYCGGLGIGNGTGGLGGSGFGASSAFGGGATGIYGTGAGAGNVGVNYGAGGSGGQTGNNGAAVAGGAGSKGVVVVTEYI